jgi:hypothetical protein
MAPLTQADEYIHPTGSEPTWREAFYFDFFDPESRLSAFGYAGVHPNQQIGDVIFALWREDVLLGSFTRWDFNIPRDIGEDRFCFGPLAFRPVVPQQQCDFLFDDGRVHMEVSFEAIHPPYDWSQSHGALQKTNSHHYEQQGRYTGFVRVGETRLPVRAVGARDRAWGWGARAGIRRWLWASAQFSPSFACNTFQLTLGDGRDVLYGYVFRGERNVLLQRSQLAVEYASIGKAPTAVQLQLTDREGAQFDLNARMLNAFNISFQERNKQGYHYFCAAEYRSQGQTGYGQTNVHWRLEPDRPRDWTVEPQP